MNKLNVTHGEAKAKERWDTNIVSVITEYGLLGRFSTKDDAELYADAHNTYNKCQQLPSELLADRDKWYNSFNEIFGEAAELNKQNEELKGALKKFFETTYHFTVQDALKNAKEVLTKRPKP